MPDDFPNLEGGVQLEGAIYLVNGELSFHTKDKAFRIQSKPLMDFISTAIAENKGDLIAGTGSDTVGSFSVGAEARVLRADPANAHGMSWQPTIEPRTDDPVNPEPGRAWIRTDLP